MTNAQQARQTLQGGNADPNASSSSSTTGGGNPLSQSAGALASQFGIIKDVLEQGIRRVTVKVVWWEGRRPQDVTVITYFTDPRKVDQAIQLSIPSNLGGTSGGTSGGSSGTQPSTSGGPTK